MKFLFCLLLLSLLFAVCINAQPRPIEKSQLPASPTRVYPESFAVKYQGGLFGYADTETGTLKLDDTNQRIVFLGKEGKEKFGIPYGSLLIVQPERKVTTATTGKVISAIPLPGAGAAGLIKEKKRYLLLHFDDPDVDAKGTASFKVEEKETLELLIEAIGVKAKLTPRGDSYFRPNNAKKTAES